MEPTRERIAATRWLRGAPFGTELAGGLTARVCVDSEGRERQPEARQRGASNRT
jgi:hypothetical protein